MPKLLGLKFNVTNIYMSTWKWELKDIETFNVRHLATMLIFHPKMEVFLSGLLEVVDLPSKRKAS